MSIDLSFDCHTAIDVNNTKMHSSNRKKKRILNAYLVLLIILPILSAVFLYLEHITHIVFLEHVAAIPLEIMFGAIIVERFLARREKKSRLRQLMYMKSHIFRSEIRDVYINNFNALSSPKLDLKKLASANLKELCKLRKDIKVIKYDSMDKLETTILTYIEAREVFVTFMDWSIQNDFENILEDMVFVLNVIQDIRIFKEDHPDELFVEHAMSTPLGREKLRKLLTDATTKFLDYAIELKSERPGLYAEFINEYLLISERKYSAA